MTSWWTTASYFKAWENRTNQSQSESELWEQRATLIWAVIKKLLINKDNKKSQVSTDRPPTQSVWYEVQEGVSQQSTWGEAEQHLEQVLVLVAVGLNRDQKQDEEGSRTDQQRRSDGLQKGWREVYFSSVSRNCKIINNQTWGQQQELDGKTGERQWSVWSIWRYWSVPTTLNDYMESLLLRGLWRTKLITHWPIKGLDNIARPNLAVYSTVNLV